MWNRKRWRSYTKKKKHRDAPDDKLQVWPDFDSLKPSSSRFFACDVACVRARAFSATSVYSVMTFFYTKHEQKRLLPLFVYFFSVPFQLRIVLQIGCETNH